MGAFADSIVAAAKRSRMYADRLLKGVSPEQFARKPVVGGVVIDCNHPAFVFGHLATYPAKVAVMVGRQAPGTEAPPHFEELFKNGAPCHDDAAGRLYPSMGAIVSAYNGTHDAVFQLVAGLSDELLAGENQEPRYREFLPTAGQGALFLLNNHVAMHLGQISTWRRCMGLPPA